MLIRYNRRSQTTFHQGLSTYFSTGFPVDLEKVQLSQLLAAGDGKHLSSTLAKEPSRCSWWYALPQVNALDGTWLFKEAAASLTTAWYTTLDHMEVPHALGIASQPRWRVSARMRQECRHVQCLCPSQHTICKLNMHGASRLFFLRLQNHLCCLWPLKATIIFLQPKNEVTSGSEKLSLQNSDIRISE